MENKFNVKVVSEKLKQYDDLLKLFWGVQGEYHGKPDDYEQKTDDFWFDEIDQNIFTFKHFLDSYLKENDEVTSRRSGLETLENQSRRKLLMEKWNMLN